jgi:hypothetical protein
VLKNLDAAATRPGSEFKYMPSPDSFVTVQLNTNGIAGAGSGVGRATTVVDASVDECVAWELARTSRAQLKMYGGRNEAVIRVNEHNLIYTFEMNLPISSFRPRDFVQAIMWRKRGDDVTVVAESLDHPGFPMRPEYVRGSATSHFEYKKLPSLGGIPQTQVTLRGSADVRGNVSK